MPTFWENVLQLARFFISSVTGLIFIILSPFIALRRNPFFFSLTIVFSILILLSLYQVLQAMLGISNNTSIL
nr:Ycf33 [Erythrotrichia welwitschii]